MIVVQTDVAGDDLSIQSGPYRVSQAISLLRELMEGGFSGRVILFAAEDDPSLPPVMTMERRGGE